MPGNRVQPGSASQPGAHEEDLEYVLLSIFLFLSSNWEGREGCGVWEGGTLKILREKKGRIMRTLSAAPIPSRPGRTNCRVAL